jgi:hypothetical protein
MSEIVLCWVALKEKRFLTCIQEEIIPDKRGALDKVNEVVDDVDNMWCGPHLEEANRRAPIPLTKFQAPALDDPPLPKHRPEWRR